MEPQLERFRAQLEKLERELTQVRRRLEALEGAVSEAPPVVAPERAAGAAARQASHADTPVATISATTITLVGRTLVVLGGAYLLRAISEPAFIPPLAGAAASLAYAAWWLVQADRSAATGRRLGAVFHGFAAAMIAYPLIWETTSRFEILAVEAAAAALVVFLGLGLAVAWRRELWEIAWTVTLMTFATAMSLLVGIHAFVPFTVALLLLAGSVELLAFRDRWLGLRWPAALGLDLAVAMTVTAALRTDAPSESHAIVSPAAAVVVSLALAALYLGSIGARTLLRERRVTPFEMVQAPAALAVGFGGAVRAIGFTGASPAAVGVAVVLLGAACYAAAFVSIDRRSGRGTNFYSYTTLAGLLVLAGSWLILGGAALASIWCALAVAAVVLGARFDRITLRFHGAVYVVAAAAMAGLVACAFDGLLADPSGAWRPVTRAGIAVAVVAAACYAILVATRRETTSRWFALLPRAIVGAVVVWSAAGMAAGWLAGPAVAALSASGSAAGAAFVAAGRTAVLAVLAVTLAWAGRRWLLQELTWLVYPVLVGGGVKLLLEDFRHGQPLALFLAFALYGVALILTPRLMRQRARGVTSP